MGLYSPADSVQPLQLDAICLLIRSHILPQLEDAVRKALVNVGAGSARCQQPGKVPCSQRGVGVSTPTFADRSRLLPAVTWAAPDQCHCHPGTVTPPSTWDTHDPCTVPHHPQPCLQVQRA